MKPHIRKFLLNSRALYQAYPRRNMKKIKILHIDPDYQGHFVSIRNGKLSQLSLPMNKTLAMVKKVKFDLILSEPQQLAIIPPEKAR